MENFIFCAVIVITLTHFVPNQASFTCTKPTAEPHRITETRYILIKTLPTKIFDLFKNLNIASCNPTEPLCWEHCQPYYWICECNNVTTSECNNEHLNLFRFVDLGFWFSLGLFRNVLPQVTIHITICAIILLWKYCTIFNSYYFPHITRSLTGYPSIHFQ